MTNSNIRASRKIRTRIEHLGSKLRLSYTAAQQHQNDQASRDGAVREVVHLYKQLRRSEHSLKLLRADDLAQKTAAATLRAETPVESALAT
jgi:hypothetical protein